MSNKRATPIQDAIQTLNYHKAVSGTTDIDKACNIGIDLAISTLVDMIPKERKLLEEIWDAGSENMKQYVDHCERGTAFTCPDKTTFFSQFDK